MGRTYEALCRAEKKHQKQFDQKKRSENFEPLFNMLGLGETQILGQNLSQLRDSLFRLNEFIANPESFFDLFPEHDYSSANELKPSLLGELLKGKELVLGYMDVIVSIKKTAAMRKLVNEISDERIRSAFSRNLDALNETDKFFIKEYEKIEQFQKSQKDLNPLSS